MASPSPSASPSETSTPAPSASSPVDEKPTGPAPTFSNGDSAAKPPSVVGGLSVPTLVAICIASLIGAAIITTMLIVWVRRRQRVQNARFEGDEEQKNGGVAGQLTGLHKDQSRSTITVEDSAIVQRSIVPASLGPHDATTNHKAQLAQRSLLPMDNVATSVVIFNQNDYINDDVMVDSNAIAIPRKSMTLERKTNSGLATSTDEFHATRVRHSIQDVNFDPEVLLEATGRHSKRSTVILDLDMGRSISEPGNDANVPGDIRKQRRSSRPLSAPFADPQREMPSDTMTSVALPVITAVAPINDTPLDVDEITKRQPTLPDLSVIASDIAAFAPGRPYAHTSEYNSSLSSSAAASPHQSVVSLPQHRMSRPYTEQYTHSRHASQTSTPRSPSHSSYRASPSLVQSDAEAASSINATMNTTSLPVNTNTDIIAQPMDVAPTNESTGIQPDLPVTIDANHSNANTFNNDRGVALPPIAISPISMDRSTSEPITYGDPAFAALSADDANEQDGSNPEELSSRRSTESIRRNHLRPSPSTGSLSRKSNIRRKKKDTL
ncbi:hypothetical protein BDF22DRAFT_741311 [Syncephalis plumigaleata]|nr:hypothetical protein BDF22DRAFT_741311 [Syncephalis plumigaleata]